jgi:mercuric ion binding protein
MARFLVGVLIAALAGVANAATPRTVVLKVENMTCPACAITIDTALDKVAGISDSRIDTKAGTVTVTIDGERISADTVAATITNAGFPARVAGG